VKGLQEYKQDVEAKQFPAQEHSFSIKQSELDKFFASMPSLAPCLKKEDVASSKISSASMHVTPASKKRCKIVVIGGGAMGSLYGAKMASLAENEESPIHPDVWLLSSWKEHVETIRR
jgi:hypothetical protein